MLLLLAYAYVLISIPVSQVAATGLFCAFILFGKNPVST